MSKGIKVNYLTLTRDAHPCARVHDGQTQLHVIPQKLIKHWFVQKKHIVQDALIFEKKDEIYFEDEERASRENRDRGLASNEAGVSNSTKDPRSRTITRS